MITKPQGQYHHGNLAESLVEYGLQELDQQGLDKISLRALARSAGVSATAAYKHFDGKDDLVTAIRRAAHQRFVDSIAKASNSSKDPEQSMMAMGVAYLQFADQHPYWFDLIFANASDLNQSPEANAAVQLFTQAAKALNPSLDDDSLRIAILQGHALIHGLAVLNRQGLLGHGSHPGLSPEIIALIFERTRSGWR